MIASSYLAGTTRRVRRVTNLRFGLIIGALQICDLPAFCGVDFEYLPAKGSVVRIDSVIAEFYLLEDLLKNMRIGELIGALNYSDNGKRPFAVDLDTEKDTKNLSFTVAPDCAVDGRNHR